MGSQQLKSRWRGSLANTTKKTLCSSATSLWKVAQHDYTGIYTQYDAEHDFLSTEAFLFSFQADIFCAHISFIRLIINLTFDSQLSDGQEDFCSPPPPLSTSVLQR